MFEQQQKFHNDKPADRRAAEVSRDMDLELRRALVPEGRVETVECRATTCRALLTFPNIEANKATFSKVMESMDSPFGKFGFNASHETAPDGSVSTTIFVNLT